MKTALGLMANNNKQCNMKYNQELSKHQDRLDLLQHIMREKGKVVLMGINTTIYYQKKFPQPHDWLTQPSSTGSPQG